MPEGSPRAGVLVAGNARDVLPRLAAIPAFKRSVKLVYLDPPFNPADAFGGLGAHAPAAWIDMVHASISSLPRLLREDAAVWFHINPPAAELCRALLDESLGRRSHRLTVLWEREAHTDFGSRGPSEDGPHNVLFLYTPGDSGPHRFEHWPTSTTGSMSDAAGEVAAIRGVTGSFPHAKPRRLIERMVERSTRSGDLILDPFAGSGTVGEVALASARRWIGVERDVHTLAQVTMPRIRRFAVRVVATPCESF